MVDKHVGAQGTVRRRRSDGRWIGTVTLEHGPKGRPIKKTLSAPSKAEAQRRVAALIQKDRGSPKVHTVSELLERWLDLIVADRVSASTTHRYRSLCRRHIAPSLGTKHLEELGAADVSQLLAAKRGEGLAAATVQRLTAMLHEAFDQAVIWGWLERDTAASLLGRDRPASSPRDLSRSDQLRRAVHKSSKHEANTSLQPISEALLKDRDVLSDEVMRSILENESAYSSHFDRSELQSAVVANMTEIYQTLGGKPLDFACFDRIGRSRAEAEFPLHALLHAYRIGGRIEWSRFAQEVSETPYANGLIIQGTTKFWEIWDAAVNRVTWAYENASARRTRDVIEERNAMVDLILSGQSAAGGLWNAAASLHLPLRGHFVTIAAVTTSRQSVLSRSASRFESLRCTNVWRVHDDVEVGVLSLSRSADLSEVLRLIDSLAQGPTGVSDPFDDLRLAPRALRQARVACDASRGNPAGATTFSSIPLQALLVLTPNSAEELRRSILGPLLEISEVERRDLITTIRTLAEAEGSVSECATRMYLHRNSIYHRLERIHELTGRNPQAPIGMAELYAAVEADRLLTNQVRQGA